jgi:hypothetical protein
MDGKQMHNPAGRDPDEGYSRSPLKLRLGIPNPYGDVVAAKRRTYSSLLKAAVLRHPIRIRVDIQVMILVNFDL